MTDERAIEEEIEETEEAPCSKDRGTTAKEIRARIIARELLSGKMPEEALRIAGYSESCAKFAQSRIIQKPIVQNIMAEAMARAGIDADSLAKVAADGLKCHKPVVVDKCLEEYPDHSTRHKYLETCVELAGLKPAIQADASALTYESLLMQAVDSEPQGKAIDCIEIVDSDDNSNTIMIEDSKDNLNTSDSSDGAGI